MIKCPGEGECHSPCRWCDECGDVDPPCPPKDCDSCRMVYDAAYEEMTWQGHGDFEALWAVLKSETE